MQSANAYGNTGERYYSDGYQKDKGITCIINNNNTILSGNETITPVEECPEADDIEGCFAKSFNDEQFELLTDALESPWGLTVEINEQDVTLRSFDDICEALEGLTTFDDLLDAVATILSTAGISVGSDVVTDIAECIAETLGIPVPSS